MRLLLPISVVVVLVAIACSPENAGKPDTAISEAPAASASVNASATNAPDPPATATVTGTATSTPTSKPPTATPTPRPPTATPPPPGFSFGNGTKKAGTDFVAGELYRTRTANNACYWARLSGFGGSLSEILANDNTNGPAVVQTAASDEGFESNRCGTWTRDVSAITKSPDDPFAEGTFIVGVDINPGTWQSDGSGSCYWQRMSGFSGKLQDIIANKNTNGPTIVTIAPTDKGFKSARCGTWRRQ